MATPTLLISEIVTNAVIHPNFDPPGPSAYKRGLTKGKARIELTDRAAASAPSPAIPIGWRVAYSLYPLEKEAMSRGVEQEPHTTVWFEVATEAA